MQFGYRGKFLCLNTKVLMASGQQLSLNGPGVGNCLSYTCNINNLRYADDTTLWQKVKKN